MEIHSQGVYKAGVIQPEQPLELPDNTKVRFVLVPEGEPKSSEGADERAKPPITREELDELILKYGVAVGTLPPDFSRDDIYSDHD